MSHQFPKVAVFIDGFNLYFGLKEAKLERYLWLNPAKLANRFINPGQDLVRLVYFTSRVVSPKDKARRQLRYLEAIGTESSVSIIYGHFLEKQANCNQCKAKWTQREEKKTDVAIATELLIGAMNDVYDAAIVVSADSDLVPPIQAIRLHFPKKRVFVKFPPNRNSAALKSASHGTININPTDLRASQFPDDVQKPDGFTVSRPSTWT